MGLAAGAAEVALQFDAAAGEHRLHLLRGFKFEVFPQISVGARDRDFLNIFGNLFVDQIVEFELALFQAGPRDDQRRGPVVVAAGKQGVQFRIQFDEARHE